MSDKMQTPQVRTKASVKNKLKQVWARRLVWECSCGCKVPKKGVALSGDSSYRSGFHVHCPVCGRVVAQFVDPKETMQVHQAWSAKQQNPSKTTRQQPSKST